jgi:hypothetical protein
MPTSPKNGLESSEALARGLPGCFKASEPDTPRHGPMLHAGRTFLNNHKLTFLPGIA